MQTKAVTILGMCLSFLLITSNGICGYRVLKSTPVSETIKYNRIATTYIVDDRPPVKHKDVLGTINTSRNKKRVQPPKKFKRLIVNNKQHINKQHIPVSEEECLAQIVYYEARDQSVKGKFAVADVTLNRTISSKFPDSVCGVVTQPKQYTGFKIRRAVRDNSTSQKAWAESKRVASIAIDNRNTVLDKDVLYFHAADVKPSWRKKMRRVARIDDHVFYARGKTL